MELGSFTFLPIYLYLCIISFVISSIILGSIFFSRSSSISGSSVEVDVGLLLKKRILKLNMAKDMVTFRFRNKNILSQKLEVVLKYICISDSIRTKNVSYFQSSKKNYLLKCCNTMIRLGNYHKKQFEYRSFFVLYCTSDESHLATILQNLQKVPALKVF